MQMNDIYIVANFGDVKYMARNRVLPPGFAREKVTDIDMPANVGVVKYMARSPKFLPEGSKDALNDIYKARNDDYEKQAGNH